MARCGIRENRKGTILPPCKEDLSEDRSGKLSCPVHCYAKLRTGKRCPNRHVRTGRGCRMHGGNARKGLSHPNIKDGAHANPLYLGVLAPARQEKFKERAAVRRKNLSAEITMLEVIAEDKLAEVESGEYVSCSALLVIAEAVIAAQVAKDREKAIEAWNNLMTMLRQGKAREQGLKEFDELAFKRMPHLLLTEAKLNVLTQEVYTKRALEQALQAVGELIKRTVSNIDEQNAIFTGINRLTGRGCRDAVVLGDNPRTRRGH